MLDFFRFLWTSVFAFIGGIGAATVDFQRSQIQFIVGLLVIMTFLSLIFICIHPHFSGKRLQHVLALCIACLSGLAGFHGIHVPIPAH